MLFIINTVNLFISQDFESTLSRIKSSQVKSEAENLFYFELNININIFKLKMKNKMREREMERIFLR